jgi:predicted secreted protein
MIRLPINSVCSLLAATLALAASAVSASAQPELSSDSVRLMVRRTAAVSLTENPTTGYRWRLNPSESRHLSIVGISNAGFTRPPGRQPNVGAAGVRHFQIVARRPGIAIVVFDYTRAFERSPPARRHAVTVEAVPRPKRSQN